MAARQRRGTDAGSGDHESEARGPSPEHGPPRRLDLTLEERVALALANNNRRLLDARLDRAVEWFSLRVAENTFRPHVTIGPYIARTHTDPSTDADTAGLATRVRLRLPTGGELGVDCEYGGRWTESGRERAPHRGRATPTH